MRIFKLFNSFGSILCFCFISQGLIKPAPDLNKALSNDPFLVYQWSLFNHSQVITSDLDDTHPIETFANPKAHINWKYYDTLMKRNIVVAVLDSGVDSSHPELKDKILAGYNFTVRSEDPKAKIFDDDLGHGTHIAGILAATLNNQEGISGLSNKIKILPLKVYDAREQRSGASGRIPIAERVAQAIEFAIANNADIIHLSMGWPRIANSKKVEAAFLKAQKNNILIVAASGNDHHEALIYPCAYSGVICVGSIDLDGKLSSFSNYGGHVDIAAPGQEILSLWPMLKNSERFGPKGYELKSGTSQAAPFVSGALAILKGIYPNEDASELRQRLLANANPFSSQIGFGQLDIIAAVKNKKNIFAAPVFKTIEMTLVDPTALTFEIPIKIEKSSSTSLDQIKFLVETKQKNIQLNLPQITSSNATEINAKVIGKIKSLEQSNRLIYSVKINGREFQHQILLTVPLINLQSQKIQLSNLETELIRMQDLRTMPDPRHNKTLRYWSYEKKENALQLYVWTQVNNQLVSKSINIEQVTEPQAGFNIIAEDWDLDGRTDFLFAGLQKNEKGEAENIHFIYLDENLKVTHRFKLKYEGVLPTYRDVKELSFAKLSFSNQAQTFAIKVPVFWDEGQIPERDRNPNPFSFEANFTGRRLYYFQPFFENNHWQMATRTITAGKFDKFIRSSFDLDATQDLEGIGVKVQTLDDAAQGSFELLFTTGRGVNVIIHSLLISDLEEPNSYFNKQNLQSFSKLEFDLSKNYLTEAWDLTSANKIESLTDFQAIFTPTSARSIILKKSQGLSAHTLSLPSRGEQIIGVLKSFIRKQNVLSFYETTEYLRAQGSWNNLVVNSKAPVYRSSFLPGALFTQLFVPVIVGRNQTPGVMFDNSRLFSNSTIIYSINQQGELTSTIKNTLKVPDNCIGKSPVFDSQGISQLIFLCDNQEEFHLLIHSLEN